MRRALAFATAVSALAFLLLTPTASADLEQVATFAEGGESEQLGASQGVAVNRTGAGGVPAGTVYVATGNLHSVAVYGPKGEFREAWGWGVADGKAEFERCGPHGEPAHPSCQKGNQGKAGEGVGQLDGSQGVAVDQGNGHVYVLSSGRQHGVVQIFSADGSQLIGSFGEQGTGAAQGGETIEEGPGKIHGTWPGGIALGPSGAVYISDKTFSWETRIMVFEPQTPGDYEHYVYAGLAKDIASSHGSVNYFPHNVALDAAGNVYTNWERSVYRFSPGEPAAPICQFLDSQQGIRAMTVNPETGEPFYFSYKDMKIHQLGATCNSKKRFEQTAEIPVTPTTELIEGLAFNPDFSYEPSRGPGALYAIDDFFAEPEPLKYIKGRGHIFAPAKGTTRRLTVTKAGTGSGVVTSEPAGIDCGATCSVEFVEGAKVTLTTKAAEGSTFAGWSGSGCSGTGICVVTMSEAKEVTATFDEEAGEEEPGIPLTVAVEGTGTGTVMSDKGAISCNPFCSDEYEAGTKVTLTATPTPGSLFYSWRYCDAGGVNGRQCTVTLDKAKTVKATFTTTHALEVSKAPGTGLGKVQSSPGGILCLFNCSETSAAFREGTEVTLKQVPAKHFHFVEWLGDCSGSGACEVTMGEDHEVQAKFAEDAKHLLTLTKSGGGAGTVKSSVAGINCGASCATTKAAYYQDEIVELTATPGKGSVFKGWSGACSGTGACTVTMDGAKEVTAEFG